MKKVMLKIIILSITFFSKSNAQNLVPNPSFELTASCNLVLQAYMADPWFQPLYSSLLGANVDQASSTDLFNTCESSGNPFGIPSNNAGIQVPRSGEGYCGFLFYSGTNGVGSREYVETELLSPLKRNKKYCVEFYVSLAESSRFGISDISVYFSNDSILFDSIAQSPLRLLPQISNPSANIIIDKDEWILVSGSFIAQGGERFITIGNFKMDNVTNYQNVGGTISFAYYYIDDVSVICCDCEPIIPTLLLSSDLFFVENLPLKSELYIYNMLGQTVYKNNNYKNDFTTINLSAGMYCYNLVLDNGDVYKGKFMVIK